MADFTRYEKLDLDPGTVPGRKPRTSGCKCILSAIGILVSIVIAKVGSVLLYALREPHSNLYENKNLGEVKDMSTVVRPVVDRYQKFDIVATVWVLTLKAGDDVFGQRIWIPGEESIFSDTVFRGVTLMDEHVHTKINLSIPLGSFAQADFLENFDIRATFKLIPQSPSLLDSITNFTTWAPATIILPDISPETRNRKMKGNFSSPQTLEALKDATLESFAISVPLIDFHPIKSSCGRVSEDSDGIYEPFAELDPVVSTKGKSALQSHPYVVTRTDLRVVRMDKIYNKKAYDDHHQRLRSSEFLNGCPGGGNRGLIDGRQCIRRFHGRANCETRIELEVPDEKTGTPQKQVAYAPFISVAGRSWGPLDVVPMPVSREGCPRGSIPEAPQLLNVTWSLAYSGSPAEKLQIAELFGVTNRFDPTDTKFNQAKAQHFAELEQRIHGHKHSPDHYVGRKLIFDIISIILSFIRINFHIHYWWTRSNTVGISIIGASLSALALILEFSLYLWTQKAFRVEQGIISSLYTFIIAAYWYLLKSSVILRTVLRLEGSSVFPYLKLLPASHMERASWRLETKGRKWWIIGILFGVFAFQFIDTLRDFSLIPHLGPDPDPIPADSVTPKAIENYLINPLFLSGTVFQVTMNYRSKTFAGQYKVAAWIHLAQWVIILLEYVPWIAWRTASQFRYSYSLDNAAFSVLAVLFALQGVFYRRVPQDIEDEDSY